MTPLRGIARQSRADHSRPATARRVARVILESMSSVCPACGIAVLPGYARCPKCHAGLPSGAGRTKRTTADPGGTAVARRGFPISAVLIAVGVAAVIIVIGTRRGTRPAAPEPAALPAPVEVSAASAAPQTAAPLAVPVAAQRPDTADQDRRTAALEVEATLRRQRLWGRAEILGPRIDVRSGSCADKAMPPAIDSVRAVLRGAGLTRLRCLAQSGAVVFERDL